MRSTTVSLALLLIAPAAFAQHRSGSAGEFASAPRGSVPMHAAGPRLAGRTPYGMGRTGPFGGSDFGRYRRGYGYGLPNGWPSYAIWDYSSVTPLYSGDEFSNQYSEEYSPPESTLSAPPLSEGPVPRPRSASSVIHNYSFPQQRAGGAAGKPAFTIVLKDGTTRSAVATWISGGRLYYLDSQSRQEVLSPGLIDRDATEHANEVKNLSMMLPPG